MIEAVAAWLPLVIGIPAHQPVPPNLPLAQWAGHWQQIPNPLYQFRPKSYLITPGGS